MKFSFKEPRASKPAPLRPGTPLPAPKKSGLERLNNLFGRQRYVRVRVGSCFFATPEEVEVLLAGRTPEELVNVSLRDFYATPDVYEALQEALR